MGSNFRSRRVIIFPWANNCLGINFGLRRVSSDHKVDLLWLFESYHRLKSSHGETIVYIYFGYQIMSNFRSQNVKIYNSVGSNFTLDINRSQRVKIYHGVTLVWVVTLDHKGLELPTVQRLSNHK